MTTEPKEINESGLTDKQERFAHEYLLDQNASAAALRAGYSAHSRGAQASQLMQHPGVRKLIRELLEELYAKLKLEALQLMQERMRTAFFDPRKLLDENSRPIPFKQLDAETAGVMLLSYDVRADGEMVQRVRQPSRAAALSALERRFMQFMRMKQEDTIAASENDAFCFSLGADPADIAAGGVIRLTTAAKSADKAIEGRAPQGSAAGIETAASPDTAPLAEAIAAIEASARAAPSPAPAPAAQPRPEPQQGAAAAPPKPALPKICVPTAKASKNGWADAWGKIDVDHPHIPPEVKARELEKRRRKQEEETNRTDLTLLHTYTSSTVGLPNPPWPKPVHARSQQRYALTEDDPYGTRGTDY